MHTYSTLIAGLLATGTSAFSKALIGEIKEDGITQADMELVQKALQLKIEELTEKLKKNNAPCAEAPTEEFTRAVSEDSDCPDTCVADGSDCRLSVDCCDGGYCCGEGCKEYDVPDYCYVKNTDDAATCVPKARKKRMYCECYESDYDIMTDDGPLCYCHSYKNYRYDWFCWAPPPMNADGGACEPCGCDGCTDTCSGNCPCTFMCGDDGLECYDCEGDDLCGDHCEECGYNENTYCERGPGEDCLSCLDGCC